MRAEFFRGESSVVGTAEWDGRRVVIQAEDDVTREALQRIFRPTHVAIDDPALRPAGTHGPTVVEPGDLEWFRMAALARAPGEGLSVRLATTEPGGWDPAGDPQAYGWGGRKPALPRES